MIQQFSSISGNYLDDVTNLMPLIIFSKIRFPLTIFTIDIYIVAIMVILYEFLIELYISFHRQLHLQELVRYRPS